MLLVFIHLNEAIHYQISDLKHSIPNRNKKIHVQIRENKFCSDISSSFKLTGCGVKMGRFPPLWDIQAASIWQYIFPFWRPLKNHNKTKQKNHTLRKRICSISFPLILYFSLFLDINSGCWYFMAFIIHYMKDYALEYLK